MRSIFRPRPANISDIISNTMRKPRQMRGHRFVPFYTRGSTGRNLPATPTPFSDRAARPSYWTTRNGFLRISSLFSATAPILTIVRQLGNLVNREIGGHAIILVPAGVGSPRRGSARRTTFTRSKDVQRDFAAWRELSWSDMSRGIGRERPSSQDELQMRAFWRRWHALMQGLRGPTDCSDRHEQREAAE